jgi:hypothetical protein
MWKSNAKQWLTVLPVVGCLAGAFLYHVGLAAAQEKPSDTKSEARALIDKAIKAHGGEANLNKFKAFSVKWEGKRKAENQYWNATTVVTFQMPERVRYDSDMQNPNGTTITITRVVTGNKGWQGVGTRSRDLPEALVTQTLDEMYAFWVASLVPLRDKEFDLSFVGENTVEGKEALGALVSRKGRADVILYFDKKSGLLLKSERRAKEGGVEFTAESFFSDYKAFGGVMWPTKRIDKRDGKDLDEGSGKVEMSDFQAIEKLDEKLFIKPD